MRLDTEDMFVKIRRWYDSAYAEEYLYDNLNLILKINDDTNDVRYVYHFILVL